MCIGVCLPFDQDTASVIIAPGDTLDFSFHFFTDPLMIGPDTASAKVKFTNANGTQQFFIQNYRVITYGQSTQVTELSKTNSRLSKIINLLGKEEQQRNNQLQIHIFDDGKIEKRIVIE